MNGTNTESITAKIQNASPERLAAAGDTLLRRMLGGAAAQSATLFRQQVARMREEFGAEILAHIASDEELRQATAGLERIATACGQRIP